MSIVKNPQIYDSKLPTNIRLREDIKAKAYAEAEERGITLAQVVNEALEVYFSRVNVKEERTDVSGNTESRMG